MRGKMKKIEKLLFFIFSLVFSGCNYLSSFYQEGEIVTPKEKEIEIKEQNDEKKLTLIVYMAADNDLESYAINNLKQMEHAVFENMNVVVLLDRADGYDETNDNWTDTRLFEIEHDESSSNFIISNPIDCPLLGLKADTKTELNLGDYNVLKNLIVFVEENYKTEKYALIIWGHGTGWRCVQNLTETNRAVAIDDKTNSYMSVFDEGRALENQNLSVIGFDTCFGGVFENVYELKNCAEYTVGTSDLTPAFGWDYQNLLQNLSECNFSNEEIAKIMAESSAVNMSVFKNSEISEVMDKFEMLSRNISETVTNLDERNAVYNQLINSKGFSYGKYPCELYLDLYSLADLFLLSSNSAICESADKLKKAIKKAGCSTKKDEIETGVYFVSKMSAHTISVQHPDEYFKNVDSIFQSSFIKDSEWWVPTEKGNSGSLLDKLFYTSY